MARRSQGGRRRRLLRRIVDDGVAFDDDGELPRLLEPVGRRTRCSIVQRAGRVHTDRRLTETSRHEAS